MKLSFLLPAYNEEKLLEYGTNVYKDYLENLRKKNKDFDYEIILCLNGCIDNSENIAKKLSKNKRIKYVTTEKGFGNGLNAGILASKNDIITFGNSDAELLPDFIEPGLELMKNNDFILGSRYLSNQDYGSNFLRKTYSRIFRFLFRLTFLFAFSEVGVIKIFRSDWGKKFAKLSKTTNFDWQVEIDAYALMTNLKTSEININFKLVRDPSESKVNVINDTLKYIKSFFKYAPKIYLSKLHIHKIKF